MMWAEAIDVSFVNLTAFWTFMATVALIVQIVLQARYARATSAKVADVAHKVVVASQKTDQKMAEIKLAGNMTAVKVEDVAQAVAESTQKTEHKIDEIQAAGQQADEKMEEIKATGDKIHKLVNNAMSLALAETARLARRVANMTGLSEDIANAEKAENASRDHDSK